MNFLFNVTLCYDKSCTRAMLFSVFLHCAVFSLPNYQVLFLTEWFCRWKPCWVLIDDTFRRAYFKDWRRTTNPSKTLPSQVLLLPTRQRTPHQHRNPHGQAVGEPDARTWKFSGTQGTSAFWEKSEAPLLRTKKCANFFSPTAAQSLSCTFVKLPYPDEEILSGSEEDVFFIQDGFTTWVTADFNTILERHVVDVRKALA